MSGRVILCGSTVSRRLLFISLLLLFDSAAGADGRDAEPSIPASARLSARADYAEHDRVDGLPAAARSRPVAPSSVVIRPAATSISLSGTLKAKGSGTGLYGKLLFFDGATDETVAFVRTDFQGAYSTEIPPGTYLVYARSYGHTPVLSEAEVKANGQRDFEIDTTASISTPAFAKDGRPIDMAIFLGGSDTTTITETLTQSIGPSFHVFNEFNNLIVDGKRLSRIRMFDDGTHGDQAANDLVYSRANVGIADAPSADIASDLVLYAQHPGGELFHLADFYVLAVAPERAVPTLEPLAGIQHGPRCANVVVDTPLEGDWVRVASQRFYRYFKDKYDFLVLVPDAHQLCAGVAILVYNDIDGIGLEHFDHRPDYGSQRLQTVIVIAPAHEPPLLHETFHRWSAYLDLFYTGRYGCHWGYSGVDGILGGFDPASLEQNPDGTYSVANAAPLGWVNRQDCADLEMYLAGFSPDIMQRDSIEVLVNGEWTPTGVKADRVEYVTASQILEVYGPRQPDSAHSQREFNVAFVGVSNRRANAATMAYLDILACGYSGLVSNCSATQSLERMTKGQARADCTMEMKARRSRAHPRRRIPAR